VPSRNQGPERSAVAIRLRVEESNGRRIIFTEQIGGARTARTSGFRARHFKREAKCPL
jgi:hypothetical protein